MKYLIVEDCPVCHSRNKDLYYKGTAGDHTLKDMGFENYACTASSYGIYFDLMKCRDCALIYAGIHPSQKHLEEAYAHIEDPLYLEGEEGRVKTFQRALKDLDRFCPGQGRMFEFGSYTGVFLELAKDDGWTIDGVELSHWARDIALKKRGINLRASIEPMTGSQRGAYDSVVIWDVIEHAADPVKVIQQAGELLKPGGVLGLSTIVLDSLSARLMKKRYPFLMEMHIIYFTRKTLVALLEQAGFEILEYKKHARFVSWWYLFTRSKYLKFLHSNPYFTKVFKKCFVQLSMGLRDVYARKSE